MARKGLGRVLSAGAVALFLGATAGAQLPPLRVPQTKTEEIQKVVDDLAVSKAGEVADRTRPWILGSLPSAANVTFLRWGQAVQLWKKEKRAGAAPFLAEGVLFDCLGRLQGVKTMIVGKEEARPIFADLAADRPKRAVKEFDAALKLDPNLIEARLRAARIRAPEDARAALELERLAQTAGEPPFAYLAAISRAEVAQAHRDGAGATHWYERALELEPQSTAATIALSALKPTAALPFGTLGPRDSYYSYPCTILTADIDLALSARLRSQVFK
ncbi:MAG TPA: hypothetical protein VJN96_25615 [Vicinamibacterales bacterium]|nr:hypothetical protein [Vicinamibacterales bacterium]